MKVTPRGGCATLIVMGMVGMLLAITGINAFSKPVALDDPCVTKAEALSAIHDWDAAAEEWRFSPSEFRNYVAWQDAIHGVSGKKSWAVRVLFDEGFVGVITAVEDEEGCVYDDSVEKVKLDRWNKILIGQYS